MRLFEFGTIDRARGGAGENSAARQAALRKGRKNLERGETMEAFSAVFAAKNRVEMCRRSVGSLDNELGTVLFRRSDLGRGRKDGAWRRQVVVREAKRNLGLKRGRSMGPLHGKFRSVSCRQV
jgi:hypothetical protein